MLEQLLVITTAILTATSKKSSDTQTLGLRLNRLNARRMRTIEQAAAGESLKAGDKTRAELIHYFGRLAETKVRSRI